MRRAPCIAVLAPALCACEPPPTGGWNGEPVDTTVMTLNVAGGVTLVAQPGRGENLAALIARAAPHFVAVQECAPCDELLAQLPSDYEMAADAEDGIALLHDASRWSVLDTDLVTLGNDDDSWGGRHARRGRFEHRDTGFAVDVYSTHFCVPIRRDDDACDEARQLDYTDLLLAALDEHAAPAILAGDFNVFVDFARGRVVARLLAAGLTDAYGATHPDDADAITFRGNTWAPPGRVDYVFTTPDIAVLSAAIDDSVPPGEGSDHHAVTADLLLGAQQ